MGVKVARSGGAGKFGSYNLTDRLHDDHLHIFEMDPPYSKLFSLSTSSGPGLIVMAKATQSPGNYLGFPGQMVCSNPPIALERRIHYHCI